MKTRAGITDQAIVLPASTIKVRLLTDRDIDLFSALRSVMLRNEPNAFSSSIEDEAMLNNQDWAMRIGPDEDTAILGAFHCGTLVGTTGLFRQRPLKTRHKATIWGVYVDPNVRGQGLARRLMLAMIEHARNLPALRQIVLQVGAANLHALTLYSNLGFQEYSHEPDALCIDGQCYAEKRLMLRLQPADNGLLYS